MYMYMQWREDRGKREKEREIERGRGYILYMVHIGRDGGRERGGGYMYNVQCRNGEGKGGRVG